MTQVVVVIGGGNLSTRAAELVDDDALVIAADSGLDHAVAAGLTPTVLVGDLDSISAAGTMWAYAHEVHTERHPESKDATDTELALAYAAAAGRDHLLVLGAVGDRFDHLLGTLSALGSPALSTFGSVRAQLGDTEIHAVHPARSITVHPPSGTVFSLLSLHGPCRGVSITGARWPLTDADLVPSSTIGVSNESVDAVHVSTREGVLTVVIP